MSSLTFETLEQSNNKYATYLRGTKTMEMPELAIWVVTNLSTVALCFIFSCPQTAL